MTLSQTVARQPFRCQVYDRLFKSGLVCAEYWRDANLPGGDPVGVECCKGCPAGCARVRLLDDVEVTVTELAREKDQVRPKKAPAPAAEAKARPRGQNAGIDWTAVDWKRGNGDLAGELGVTPTAVRSQRKRWEAAGGPQPVGGPEDTAEVENGAPGPESAPASHDPDPTDERTVPVEPRTPDPEPVRKLPDEDDLALTIRSRDGVQVGDPDEAGRSAMERPTEGNLAVFVVALLKAARGPVSSTAIRRAVLRLFPETDPAVWGRAVRQLRATQALMEDDEAATWAAGPKARAIETAGWPDEWAADLTPLPEP